VALSPQRRRVAFDAMNPLAIALPHFGHISHFVFK
jgi:hypothetical protein